MSTDQAKKHDFVIQVAPCNITGSHTKVIAVNLGTLDIEPDTEPRSVQVYATYSAEGLDIMKRALEESPLPVDLPAPEGIRINTKYMWVVQFMDSSFLSQFPGDHHFGEFDPHQVARLWIKPKDRDTRLPSYLWDRKCGFFRSEAHEGIPSMELLKSSDGELLPFPEVPCHLEYQRCNTITFAAGPPGSEVFPTHVRHELGWRVDKLHGDDHETTFLIAIEDDDGSWQIIKKEPENSRHFGPRVIEGEVRIIGFEGDNI